MAFRNDVVAPGRGVVQLVFLFSRRPALGNKPDLIARQVLGAFVPDPLLRPVRDAPGAPAKRQKAN
jgi:hypothetical protein